MPAAQSVQVSAPAAEYVPAAQLEHPSPWPLVSQPLALYVPEGHGAVFSGQLALLPPLHVLVSAPVQVPGEQTQPEKSVVDVELAGQSVQDPEPEAENWPGRHCVQVTLALTPLPAWL